jgi:ATP-dependent Clp protease ATP-binding subunit ClpC
MRRKRSPAKSVLPERDLTELARGGRLVAAHGLEAEVDALCQLLGAGGQHLLLSGESGTGKTARMQEVARRVALGTAGAALAGARVVELSLQLLLARGGEERCAALWEELVGALAESAPLTVVLVRDAGVALGTPLLAGLASSLRTTAPRMVLEAEPRRANALMRAGEGLGSQLHLVQVAPPSAAQTRWILGKVAEEVETSLGVRVDPAACELVQRLTERFLLAERQPGKSVALLRSCAEAVSSAKGERLSTDGVLERFCNVTRLPRFLLDDAVPLDLEDVERFFNERILGQREAVAAILRPVALLKAGLNDPRRPLGLFLCAGPTGVGKTHLARLLAEYLFGSSTRLVRVNMADYPTEGDDAVLWGVKWAPVRDARRGLLSQLLDDKLFAVLLLDEFEKAHSTVHDRFLQLFDEGQFINGADEVVACNNALMIATSNAGAETYREPPFGFTGAHSSDELVAEVDRRLALAFRHEFLNRFDAICHFRPLGKVEIRRIAHREVGRALEREGIRARGLDVEVSPEVVDLLVERGYSPHFGARFLQREIEKTMTVALATEIVRRPLSPGSRVRVAVEAGRVVARAELRQEPEARTQVSLPRLGATSRRRHIDRRSLLSEATELQQRATRVASALNAGGLVKHRADLLTQTQAPDFWDDPERAAQLLRTYRSVEAQLQDLERLRRTCESAHRMVRESKAEARLAAAARAVEAAAREVQLAEARVAAGGNAGDEALLELTLLGGEDEAQWRWLDALVSMYRGWAERRGYEAALMAETLRPPSALLHLTGPGVLGFLAGEEGIHRSQEEASRSAARLRVHRWPAVDGSASGVRGHARTVRRRAGRYVERITTEFHGTDDDSGREVELLGGGGPEEMRTLAAVVLRSTPPASDARNYFFGRAARVEDPRTGAATPRVKDVLRGEIELFIASWFGHAIAR